MSAVATSVGLYTVESIPVQATLLSFRNTPPCFGFGLVEAIADADIQVREAIPPPGVSGRVNWVTPAPACHTGVTAPSHGGGRFQVLFVPMVASTWNRFQI